ncbi:MAG: FadR family transcriptional regulator [Chloroflexia bacterium]|nr:FadR family transcriptional regulator [Chloroflexia bacterium]
MSISFTPVDLGPREPISLEIARRLVDYLLSGQVAPGERIPSERQLAQDLGVGRSAVREAIKSLALLGLVEVRQGDGTYLWRIDTGLPIQKIEWGLLLGVKRTHDLVEARRHLELAVAGLAAERRDEAAVLTLRELFAEMEAAASDPDRFVNADVAFHLRIAEATGNEVLVRMMSSISELLRDWIARVMRDEANFRPSLEEHRAVLAAIVAGDANAARSAMLAHMDGAASRLATTIRNGGHEAADAR